MRTMQRVFQSQALVGQARWGRKNRVVVQLRAAERKVAREEKSLERLVRQAELVSERVAKLKLAANNELKTASRRKAEAVKAVTASEKDATRADQVVMSLQKKLAALGGQTQNGKAPPKQQLAVVVDNLKKAVLSRQKASTAKTAAARTMRKVQAGKGVAKANAALKKALNRKQVVTKALREKRSVLAVLRKETATVRKQATKAARRRSKQLPGPVSAYTVFASEHLKGVKGAEVRENMKAMAKRWNALSVQEKAEYAAKAQKNKADAAGTQKKLEPKTLSPYQLYFRKNYSAALREVLSEGTMDRKAAMKQAARNVHAQWKAQ
eukprot:Hpha_TRINITY_DN15315_c8_g5::TRINITY_DN15315_c8_g5_i1::g.91419::m.91419